MNKRIISLSTFFSLILTIQVFATQDAKESRCSSCINKYEKYIKSSTWVVPPETLHAYNDVSSVHNVVSSQTVWVIKDYDKGYFFGDAYTSIDRMPSSHLSMVGSVTPLGDVSITFYPADETPQSTNAIKGSGRLEQINGDYTFIMQMNGAQNTLGGLRHWHYMVSVKSSDKFYKHLPGEDISVVEFINQF